MFAQELMNDHTTNSTTGMQDGAEGIRGQVRYKFHYFHVAIINLSSQYCVGSYLIA